MGQNSSQVDQSALDTDYGRSVSPTPALSDDEGRVRVKREIAEVGDVEEPDEDTLMAGADIDTPRPIPASRPDIYEVPASPRRRSSSSKRTRRRSPHVDAKPVITKDDDEQAAQADLEPSQDRPRKRRRKAHPSTVAAAVDPAPPQVQVPASQPLPATSRATQGNNVKYHSGQLSASPENPHAEPQVIVPATERQQAAQALVAEVQRDADEQSVPMAHLAKKSRKRKKSAASPKGQETGNARVDQASSQQAAAEPSVDVATEQLGDTKPSRKKKAKNRSAEPEEEPEQNVLERIESGLGVMESQPDPALEDAEPSVARSSDVQNRKEQPEGDADEEADAEADVHEADGRADAEEVEPAWPTSDDPEVQALLADEDWRNGHDLLVPEQYTKKPRTEREKHVKTVIQARNKLREHCERLLYEQKLFKGMAREVQDEDGNLYAEYAENGERFDIPERSAAERKAAKKRQKSLKRLRESLVESLAQSEVEARRRGSIQGQPPQDGSDSGEDELEVHNEERGANRTEPMKVEGTAGTGPLVASQEAHRRLEAVIADDEVEQAHPAGRAEALVPTPPTSEEPRHKYSAVDSQDAKSQVSQWLASQTEVPQDPPDDALNNARKQERNSDTQRDAGDDAPGAVLPPDSDSVADSVRAEAKNAPASGKKRKANGSMAPPPKPRRKSTDPSERRRSVTRISGPFDNEEKATADRVFGETMRREGMTKGELIAAIQNWRNLTVFKADILEAFPERTTDAVRKFCLRRYHDQERGPWTEEQDQALRDAYARNPGKWSRISDSVGRTGSDCKDRWTKHLQYRERATGPWSVGEEANLLAAVEDCLKSIKRERKNDRDLLRDIDRLESLINWRVVSDKLNGKRAADKCREKYQRLRQREARDQNIDDTTSAGVRAKEASKLAAAKNTVNDKFEIGDYYDVFAEIHKSFTDHNQHFQDEKNVLWSIISSKNMNSRFNLSYSGGALRRAALEKAIEEWPIQNSKIKRRLQKVDTIPAKALVLAKWIESSYPNGLDTMKRTYKPEMIGKSAQELAKIKRGRKEAFKKRTSEGFKLSRDYVEDSDDELENSGAGKFVSSPAEEEEDIDAEPKSSEGASTDDEREASAAEKNPPETPAHVDEDVPMTDVESLNGVPSVAPAAFVDRLKSGGSNERRRIIAYGKKERRRRSLGH